AIAAHEIMQLLRKIIFVLTPDDRNASIFRYAVGTVARAADLQPGSKFPLGVGIGGGLSRICRHGHNSKNAQNSRKLTVDHVLRCPFRAPPQCSTSKNARVRVAAQEAADDPFSPSRTALRNLD